MRDLIKYFLWGIIPIGWLVALIVLANYFPQIIGVILIIALSILIGWAITIIKEG